MDDGFGGLLLAAAIHEYRELAPDAEIGVRSCAYGAGSAELLADGSADFALVGVAPRDPGARSVVVGSCRRALLAAAEHRLADVDFLSLEELRGEPELRARGACAEARMQWSIAGLTGESGPHAGECTLFAEALDLVAAGQGIVLAPDIAQRRFARADVSWIPIMGLDPLPVHLAWRRRNVPRSRAEALVAAFERTAGRPSSSISLHGGRRRDSRGGGVPAEPVLAV